jgi:hypothetical protein
MDKQEKANQQTMIKILDGINTPNRDNGFSLFLEVVLPSRFFARARTECWTEPK